MFVICALAYEHRSLRRARIPGVQLLEPCGPGGRAIDAWAERFEREHGREIEILGKPIVLAGLAGALNHHWRIGDAAWIRTVRLQDDRLLSAPYCDGAGEDRQAAADICTSERIVNTAAEREALAARTGCSLVDQESAAFAETSERYGWRWGIVRGVSDTGEEGLPPGVDAWVDERGRSRIGRVVKDLARHPGSIAAIGRLSRASRIAMNGVANQLADAVARSVA